MPSIVLGPGDIAQAHVADEWVGLEQLETACELYQRVMKNDG
jgi:acetylornithine deacetylase/succinyl-diaminopimelate desuccinylase-like protein